MKTPVTKPLKQGRGSVVRFMNDEMDAIIAGLSGSQDDLAVRMRERLEKARSENAEEARIHDEHARTIHEMSHTRLAMRGWTLASASSDKIELHLRHGDFLRDGDGWQYGMPGAFDDEHDVLRGSWQACLFSRRTRRWLIVTDRPSAHETAMEQGLAALKAHKAGLKEGAGVEMEFRSFTGVVGKVDAFHYYRGDICHHASGGEAVATIYGGDVRVTTGRAIVRTVVGYFETTHNHRWHPTYDVWVIVEPRDHDRSERTGPFWCASAPVWSLSIKGTPDFRVLHEGPHYMASRRDRTVFAVFGSRDEAVAYAAAMTVDIGGHPRNPFRMTVEVPDILPVPVPTPLDETGNGDVFAQAA